MSTTTELRRRSSPLQQAAAADYTLAIGCLSPLPLDTSTFSSSASSSSSRLSSSTTPTLSYYHSQRRRESERSTGTSARREGVVDEKALQMLSTAREVLVGTVCALGAVSLVMNTKFFVQGKLHFSAQIGANAELIFASSLLLGTILPLHYFYRPSNPRSVFSTLLVETLLLFVLFLFFFSASSYLSQLLPSLSHCSGISLCEQMKVIKFLAWMETTLLGVAVGVMSMKGVLVGGWLEEFDGSSRRRVDRRGELKL